MTKTIALGAAGLGRAFSLMARAFGADPRVRLVAGADPRPEARERFERDFQARAYAEFEQLCGDAAVQVVYIATPHQFHAAQACVALAHGKHVLVEKPMALTAEDCRSMIEAARRAGVVLMVGHSHSFDLPVLHARRLIDSRAFGAVRMVSAVNFTDFLYRPRRPEELDTARGGGAVYNQAAHQVDMVRLLAGSVVKRVTAMTGAWDPRRPTEGAYACLLGFENGAFATLTYGGYGHFDSDELTGWIGELGQRKDPAAYRGARVFDNEAGLKNSRNYGGAQHRPPDAVAHEHFGLVIVSCDKADLRPQPDGVMIYGDSERRLDPLPAPAIPRREVIDELYGAVAEGRAPLHGGEWAAATVDVCLAILRSAREQREVAL